MLVENKFKNQNFESMNKFDDEEDFEFVEEFYDYESVNNNIDNLIIKIDYEKDKIIVADRDSLFNEFYKYLVCYDDELTNRQQGVIKTFIELAIDYFQIATLNEFIALNDKISIVSSIISELESNPDQRTYKICMDLLESYVN